MSVRIWTPRHGLRRLLTSPMVAMLLLAGSTVALLLTEMRAEWALVTVAAASGVSLSGST